MQPGIHLLQIRPAQAGQFSDNFLCTHIGTVAQTGVPDKRKRLTAIAACPIPVMRERLTVQRASRAQNQKLPGEILNSISRAKEMLKYGKLKRFQNRVAAEVTRLK